MGPAHACLHALPLLLRAIVPGLDLRGLALPVALQALAHAVPTHTY